MKLNKKGFTLIEGLLVGVVVLAVGFGGYYIFSQNNNDDSEETVARSSSQDEDAETDADELVDEAPVYEETVELMEPAELEGVTMTATGAFESSEEDNTNDFNIADSANATDYLVIDFTLQNTSDTQRTFNVSEFQYSAGGVDYTSFLEWVVDPSIYFNGDGDEKQPAEVVVEPGESLEGTLLVFTVEGAPDPDALPSDSASGVLKWVSLDGVLSATVNVNY